MGAILKQRILWVDVLKGIAIMLVVTGHSAVECGLNHWAYFIYSFHMPLFFLLSGFLFTPRPEKEYLRKSARRLLLPFAAFVLLMAVPFFASWIIHLDTVGAAGVIKPLKIMLLGGVMATAGWYTVVWFVTVLWLSTNLFNFIASRKLSLLLIVPLLLTGYLATYLTPDIPFHITIVPMATAYIWLGFIIGQNIERLREYKRVGWIIGVLAIILTMWKASELRIDMKHLDYGIPVISLALSIILSATFAMIAIELSKIKILSSAIALLGEASMVIMYLHLPLREVFLTPFRSHLVPDTMPWLYLVWALLIGLILPTGFYLIALRFRPLRKLFLGKK